MSCRFHRRNIVIIIRGVDDLVDLRLQRIIVPGILIAEGKHRNTSHKIQIPFSFYII